jgi:KDO2-lipid IV(A) lauroyltransferase
MERPNQPVDQQAQAGVPRRRPRRGLWRRAGYLGWSLVVIVLTAPIRVLPIDLASGLGGWFVRTAGPHSRRHDVARKNLRRAIPELSDAEVESTLLEMWDNLGRDFAEYFHLDTFARAAEANDGRIEFRGVERLHKLIEEGRNAVFIGTHLANLEMGPLLLHVVGVEHAAVYRPFNNAYLDRLVQKRRARINPIYISKGPDGAKDMVAMLRKGGSVLMAVDQKFNEGLPVPFFGRAAMTTTGYAKLAQRYRLPVIPIRAERLGGARFRVTVYPPIELPEADDSTDGTLQIMTSVNQILESWIRERPGQWLWMHRRWPD